MNQEHFCIMDKFHTVADEIKLAYAIIGGYASSYWGDQRTTLDVDYVTRKSDVSLVKSVMERIGYYPIFLHPNLTFGHFLPNEGVIGPRVDFMMVDEDTWNKLANDFCLVEFGNGSRYPLVSLLHLVSMKIHSASQPDRKEVFKDLNDIVGICLNHNLTLNDLEENGILSKYGNERSITRLREIFSDRAGK